MEDEDFYTLLAAFLIVGILVLVFLIQHKLGHI